MAERVFGPNLARGRECEMEEEKQGNGGRQQKWRNVSGFRG